MARIRTRARAVDMLGRQQIAGVQNAISELFKNAYDAYAKNAEVDFFEEDNLLVIRDNGVGMTTNDFEERWLVLGTESKAGDASADHYRPPKIPKRPITGEKGIGRLAIALLGRQVLVLSRASRADVTHDLVVSYIHWGLFELPGLNLDEIEIPMLSHSGGGLPDEKRISSLQTKLKKSVEQLAKAHKKVNFDSILKDISDFKPDPADLDSFFRDKDPDALSLAQNGCGTHFLIGPANPILKIELAAEDTTEEYGFRKHLMGFCNSVFLEKSEAPIQTGFRRWKPGWTVGDQLLEPSAFFTPEDLSNSDHLITGDVDDYGQFKGEVRIFDQVFPDQIISWRDNVGRPTLCGKFRVQFGYLMALAKDSKLPLEEYAELRAKVDQFSGLYIYRDRIRVLPYGDNQFDWLDIEVRRTKGAAHYFFSYRNLLGGVLITRAANHDLQEKAGREGFQQNLAYRQLRDILINLLRNLAAEFFRKGGTKAEYYETKREEYARMAAALERREKSVATKRHKLESALGTFFEKFKSGLPATEIANLRMLTKERMNAASSLRDRDQAAGELIKVERAAIRSLQLLRDSYSVKKPTGVGLTRNLRREWDGYLEESSRLEKEVFAPYAEEIARTLGEAAKQAHLYVNQRKRLEERLAILAEDQQKRLKETVDDARQVASETRATVFDVTQKAMFSLDDTIKRIEADLNRKNLDILSPADIESLRAEWENQLMTIETRHRESLIATRDMLASLSENLQSGNGEQPTILLEAMEERMLALEDQSDNDFEMVQLGLAVAIINHEFGAAIKNVRHSIKELGNISQRSVALRPLYTSIRENFQHLDGHLNLFTPLQRRLYRSAVKIDGASIRNYVRELFANRLERHEVALECSEAFEKSSVICYPSTLYPVFINLVDNAISWLANSRGNRKISFDSTPDGFLVSNTGPSIQERDKESIFERGFTRRAGGRGLGLFVSKRALQHEKMDLKLVPPSRGFNVSFQITATEIKFI